MFTLPSLPRRINRTINMPFHLGRLHPRTSILLKRLYARLELGLLQTEIVNCANTRNAHAGVAATTSIQERTADTAEAVLHVVSRGYCGVLAETGEFFFAAEMRQVGGFDDEVGGEHAGTWGVRSL